MARVKSGIPGFDEIVGGGIPRGSTIAIVGGPGTGKSIFCMQFLYNGAQLFNEPGIFVSLEERPAEIKRDMLKFGWNIEKIEEERKLVILDASASRLGVLSKDKYALDVGFNLDILCRKLGQVVNELDAKRVAIDSATILKLQMRDEFETRKAMLRLNNLLIDLGCTSLITLEMPRQIKDSLEFGLEEYVFRGVIHLFLDDEVGRTIVVRKMRGTRHATSRYILHIGDKGLEVKPAKIVT
ncbi:MAG: ATPase domain-containing protein [Candidatus Hydrothermarchaeota archaeon]